MAVEKYIAQMEAHETAARIAEAIMGMSRPSGFTAEQAMLSIAAGSPDFAAGCYRAALAPAKYFEEAVNNFQRVQ